MPPAHKTIPEALKAIQEQVSRYVEATKGPATLQDRWAAHVASIRAGIPAAHVEQAGESLYLGDLSQGCQACKQGQWDCIFVTMKCNLECPFCWRPATPTPHHVGSALAESREDLPSQYEKVLISGVSFSGGEPFLEGDKLVEWVTWFTSRYPEKYYWMYTNGLLATEEMLARLADLGLHEIRFNLAASGYTHPTALKNLVLAVKHLPFVTVEIPAIPEHRSRVLEAVDQWSDIGVRYLNLHELIYEPRTNSAGMPGARESGNLQDGHPFDYNPDSRSVTRDIMEKVYTQKLPISVNDCSLQSKVRQLRGRRQLALSLFKAPHEELISGYQLVSYCAYRDGEMLMIHPSCLEEMRRRYPHHRFVRLARTVPLSWSDPGLWCIYEPLA